MPLKPIVAQLGHVNAHCHCVNIGGHVQNTGHELSHSFSGMNLHNCKFLDLRPQDLSHEHYSVATIQFNSENSNLENKKNNPIAHKFLQILLVV